VTLVTIASPKHQAHVLQVPTKICQILAVWGLMGHRVEKVSTLLQKAHL